jgi:hypothetical protein
MVAKSVSRLKPRFTVFNLVLKHSTEEGVDEDGGRDADVEEEDRGESECQTSDSNPGGAHTDAEGKRNCRTLSREFRLQIPGEYLHGGSDLACNRRTRSPDSSGE